MTDKQYKTTSRVLIIIAVILIAFGCFAPMIFTAHGSERMNFTQTGAIGDTIGGTMGPFIAIAGVIATFIAFLMQVQANQLQREQLKKSFHLNNLQSRIEERNALQLLSIDINNALDDINVRSEEIDKYCDVMDEDPFSEVACKKPSERAVGRYQTIDRNKLFDAFQHFVPNGVTEFRIAYSTLDFYYDAVKSLSDDVYSPYTKEISSRKEELPSKVQSFIKEIISLPKVEGEDSINCLQLLFVKKVIMDSFLFKNGLLQLQNLVSVVNDMKYYMLYKKVHIQHQELLNVLLPIGTQGRLLSKEMRNTSQIFTSADCHGQLERIKDILESSLEQHTIESIQNEFEEKI